MIIAQGEVEKLVDARNITVAGLLLVFVIGFIKGWIVTLAQLTRERQLHEQQLKAEQERTQLERERGDRWEAIVLRQIDALRAAQEVARGGQQIGRDALEVVKSNSDKDKGQPSC